MNKKAMSVSVLFYIMMSIFMVWIIIFGYQKITDTQNVISQQEIFEIEQEITQKFEYCDDPLKRDSQIKIKVKSNNFNVFCLLGEDSSSFSILGNELDQIFETGDNIVLMKTNLNEVNGNYQIPVDNYNIVSTFRIDLKNNQQRTDCWNDQNEGRFDIVIDCE